MLAMLAARLPGVVKHRPLSSAFRALMSLPFQTSDPSPAFPHNHGLSRLKRHLRLSRKLMGSSWSLSKKSHQTKGPISLSHVGSASLVGRRRTNEDRFRISQMTDDIVYLAVFDGHGGREAVDFCEANMEENIKDLVRNTQNLDVVLSEAFLEVDKALAEHSRLCQSGTTATVALLRDNSELVVASVGDSRALLCRGGKCLQLSDDHTAERKDERRRIQSSGGFIVWSRCAGSYVNGQLAMTRSIGDFKLKEFGVIAEPEVKRIVLNHEDSFLALTTDGIHGVMKNQEICSIVSQSLDPHQAAQRVCRQALGQGSEDNVTIIVLPLGGWRQEVKTD